MEESKLPLGICRHCVSALELALTDVNEVLEDDEVTNVDKQKFEYISSVIGDIMATITNLVMNEMDEEDFMSEHLDLSEISHESLDILDEEI